MKKTFTKKTLVAGIAAALMTLTATNVNAKETFIYGQNQQSLIVSTLNEDGKTLTPKWKYEYQYDRHVGSHDREKSLPLGRRTNDLDTSLSADLEN